VEDESLANARNFSQTSIRIIRNFRMHKLQITARVLFRETKNFAITAKLEESL